MTKRLVNPIVVSEEKSALHKLVLTDGSYIQWDIQDGVFRVAYYARKTARGFHFRETLAVTMRKQPYSRQVSEIMEYLEERDEYVNAVSSKEMVQ